MPLIARTSKSKQTIGRFRKAARQRFKEARRSAAAGDRLIGIYLGGYSAEMILKAAYFRLAGSGDFDTFNHRDMQEARKHAIRLGVVWDTGGFHYLPGWANLLTQERVRQEIPYPGDFARILSLRVNQIYQNWREDIRYHINRPRPGEFAATFEAVTWLLKNDGEL